MRRSFVAVAAALAVAALPAGAQAAPQVVFTDDFSGVLKTQWSGASNITSGATTVLGSDLGAPFSNAGPATLTLTGLPAHDSFSLAFDLYMLNTMDGTGGCCQDYWDLDASGTLSDIQGETSFSNGSFTQCYPDACPAAHPGLTGAEETANPLLFGVGGSRYRMEYTAVPHSDGTLTITFKDRDMQGWNDEGWVIDDLTLSVDSSGPVCTIVGDVGNNVLTGTELADVICGGDGNDTIVGLGGDDEIYGGGGIDRIAGGAGDDTIDGGDDSDTLHDPAARTGMVVDLGAGTATGGSGGSDTFTSIERVEGTGYDDEITGTTGADALLDGRHGDDDIDGLGGNDTLLGGFGTDDLDGGDGNDLVMPGVGDDTATGGDGGDKVSFAGASAPVHVNLGLGYSNPLGGSNAGSDTFSGFEEAIGTSFGDTLIARVTGAAHTLTGGGGDDLLDTRDGDSLDRLAGGLGDDGCLFNGADRVSC